MALEKNRYMSFTTDEWQKHISAAIRQETIGQLSNVTSNIISNEETTKIYVPLVSKIINEINILNSTTDCPFILGIAGSVSSGKSTFTKHVYDILESGGLNTALITTDGFIFSNKTLKEKGLYERKGFPESYDHSAMAAFISDIKGKAPSVQYPTYSHLYFDSLGFKTIDASKLDVLIIEGVNTLQTLKEIPLSNITPLSSFVDYSIYLHADEVTLENWFQLRFTGLQTEAKNNPEAFFYKFKDMNPTELTEFAKYVWDTINLINLHEHILPTMDYADCILVKNSEHSIKQIKLKQS